MIDYNEMEKVIKNLNEYVSKVQQMSKVQGKLDETLSGVSNIAESLSQIDNDLKDYSTTIAELEDKHRIITSQFDTVLQDYKKLHSSFELLDIELKKITLQNEDFNNALTDIKMRSQSILDSLHDYTKAQANAINKIYAWLGIITLLVGSGLLVLFLRVFGLM